MLLFIVSVLIMNFGFNSFSVQYFSVIAVRAEIGNREVHSWTQPLVKSAQEGIIAFIVKEMSASNLPTKLLPLYINITGTAFI